MNTLTRAASDTVQGGMLMGIMTVLFLAFFIGWIIWAYSPARKQAFDEAARIPFTDGGAE